MENTFQFNVATQGNELIIRQGKALEPKEPRPVQISGILDSPARFLALRIGEINPNACHILVDRERLTITLHIEETSHYRHTIQGKLEVHPLFTTFGINSGRYVSNFDMAQLFKMNRTAFEVQSVAMQLVSDLQNFRAKVDKEVEKMDDNRGNKRNLVAQVVESNLPSSFNLKMPIFKGTAPQVFEVEVYIKADDFSCTLISPVANDLVAEMRDTEIDAVLRHIIDIAPGIVIIEQ